MAHSETADSVAEQHAAATFERLAAQWRREVDRFPTVGQMVGHPCYDAIVELGPSVIPVLLGELSRRPDHWFYALTRITGSNPAEDKQTFSDAVAAWLDWGREHGYERWVQAPAT